MANTAIRTVRVDDRLWAKIRARARRDGVDVSTAVREALAAYASDDLFLGIKPPTKRH